MTKKELVYSALKNFGYNPTLDDDGDMVIRYQLKNIWVMVNDDDDPYVSVILPQFYEIKEGNEILVLATCNRVTRDVKLVKVYIDQTLKSVTALCGFYYTDEESMAQGLSNSLRLLGMIRSYFRKIMLELSE